MPELEGILVADLRNLSAEDLRSKGIIKLEDPWNLTAADMDKLRTLVNGVDKSRPLDLGVLDEKLRNFAQVAPVSPRSRPSMSPTPTLDDHFEEYLEIDIRQESEAYNALILDGGRPLYPFDDLGFGILDEPGDYAEIISYWRNGTTCQDRYILQKQHGHWQQFREHQDYIRERYHKPEWFENRTQFICEYRKEKGLQGNICLLQNREAQSRLDDWKEFQFREYRKADGFVKEMDQAGEDLKKSEMILQAAIAEGRTADRGYWIIEEGVAYEKSRIRTAEGDLKRHASLLKWIDEQLPIIASESADLGICSSEIQNGHQPSSVSTHLGKRKRLTEDATDRTASPCKLSKSCHVTDSCYRSEVDKGPGSAVLPDMDTDPRDLRLVELPHHSVPGSRLRRSKRIADSRREETITKLAASALRPGRSSTVKNNDHAIRKRLAAPSAIRRQVLNTSHAAPIASQASGPGYRRPGRSQGPLRLGKLDPKLKQAPDSTGSTGLRRSRRSRRILEKRENRLSSP